MKDEAGYKTVLTTKQNWGFVGGIDEAFTLFLNYANQVSVMSEPFFWC
jgi:hypothetical protein